MNTKSLNFLVVEDNEGDFVLFEAYLQQSNLSVMQLYQAKSMSEIDLADKAIDIAFLDLTLPDSGGIESFSILNQLLPHVPIVVLSGMADEKIALQCITLGAQDYLLKNELNERLLEKSVYYSIERKKNLEAILKINEQYELIGKVTNDVIWNWNLDTNEISCAQKSFLGYPSTEIDKTLDWWIEKIHPDDREQITQALMNVLEKRSAHLQIEYRFLAGDGSYQYLFSRGALLPTKKDEHKQMIGAIMNVTERKRLEDELLVSQLNFQRQMTEATILGQEKQKEQIGKELHDNINQILASVKLYMETAMDNPGLKDEMINRSKTNIVYAIEEVRKLSHSLIPPSLGAHGLLDAVRFLVEEINATGRMKVRLSSDNFDEAMMENTKKLMLYRIVQEQMNNVIKYAKAKEVCVLFNVSGSGLLLSITDDGVGFDTTKKTKGIGLKNIDSRVSYYAGNVQLHSAPGKGTTLKVFIPL